MEERLKYQNTSISADIQTEIKEERDKFLEVEKQCSNVKQQQTQLLDESEQRAVVQTELKEALQQITQLKAVEKQLTKELSDEIAMKKGIQDELRKTKEEQLGNEKMLKALQDQLEAEQYFSMLYKAQTKELKEELDDKVKQCADLESEYEHLEHERDVLTAELQKIQSCEKSEQAMCKKADVATAQFEKERTLIEQDRKEMSSRLMSVIALKDKSLSNLEDHNAKLMTEIQQTQKEKEGLAKKCDELRKEMKEITSTNYHGGQELQEIKKQLADERRKKEMAVMKIAEIMKHKGNTNQEKGDYKEFRKIEQDLRQEKETLDGMLTQLKHDLCESQAMLYEEAQKSTRLQLEVASKDQVIELLSQKLAHLTSAESTDELTKNKTAN